MAYIDQQDPKKQQQNQGQDYSLGGTGSFSGGGGMGATPEGKGGRQQFMNIQSYLTPGNVGASGTANYLEKQASDIQGETDKQAKAYQDWQGQGSSSLQGNLQSLPFYQGKARSIEDRTNQTGAYAPGGAFSKGGAWGQGDYSSPEQYAQQQKTWSDYYSTNMNPQGQSWQQSFNPGQSELIPKSQALADTLQVQGPQAMSSYYKQLYPGMNRVGSALQQQLDVSNAPQIESARQKVLGNLAGYKTGTEERQASSQKQAQDWQEQYKKAAEASRAYYGR